MTDPTNDLIPLQSNTQSSTPQKRVKRADALANRQLVLETAQRLFSEQGIQNVKMMALAEAAGLGQGTLYRAFANKGEVCLALMDEDLRHFQDETLHLLRTTTHTSVLDQLGQFLEQIIYFLDQHAALMCEVQGYEIIGDEINHTGLHTWFHHTINLLLQQAQRQGEVRANLDLAYATDAILAPLHPNLFTYQRQTLGLSLEKISQELRGVIWGGIRRESIGTSL